MVAGELGTHQRGGQPRESGRAVDQPIEPAGIVRKLQRGGGGERPAVGKGDEFVPHDLYLTKEDVDTDVAEALQLSEQTPFGRRVTLGGLTQAPKISVVAIKQELRQIAEHRRGALSIAGVAALGERFDPRSLLEASAIVFAVRQRRRQRALSVAIDASMRAL